MTGKRTPIERALIAAANMPAPQARRVLMLICESGMRLEPMSEGAKHFAKREKFINRMDETCKRVIDYAKHETLRKIEKHFRESAIASGEGEGHPFRGNQYTEGEAGEPFRYFEPTACTCNPYRIKMVSIHSSEGDPGESESLAVRLTFDKTTLSKELLAGLAEDQAAALATSGQQLFDEIGRDSVWRIPSQDALQFIEDRANLLANVPDDIHTEIMQSIEQGLQGGESRKELMARISAAFDEIGKSRAETISNTETAAAFNYSRDKAMREAGVTHKRWLHSMSPLIKEPRPTHLDADGQTVPIDEPFDVAGVLFMMPTDTSLGAGPEDIINCHCVSIAVATPEE